MFGLPADRRALLRHVSLGTGGLLLSPVLRQLRTHAAGEAVLPKRFVFVTVSNGLNPNFIQPKTVERDRRFFHVPHSHRTVRVGSRFRRAGRWPSVAASIGGQGGSHGT